MRLETGRVNDVQICFKHDRTSVCCNRLRRYVVRGEMPIKFRNS